MSEPTEYENFDLLVERSGRDFRVSVFGAPAGDGRSVFRPPYSEDQLQKILAELTASQRDLLGPAESPRQTLEAIGKKLFEALFRGEVAKLWVASRAKMDSEGKGLRLRLRFINTPRFEAWPWELLYDPSRRKFVSLSVRTSVVRYLDLSVAPPPLLAEPPLRMLIAVAQPSGYATLNANREIELLHQALKSWEDQGLIIPERLERATLEELQKKLLDSIHILHIVGHGRFDSIEKGALLLEDGTGGARVVPGSMLGTIVSAQKALRLVVLNCCEGALTSQKDLFAGVAQALVGSGIPAVIAMRSRISDPAAVAFAEHFYGALGRNLPVDRALGDARRALYSRPESLEWTAPVLYTRSTDCRLFRFPAISTGLPPVAEAAEGSGKTARKRLWPAWLTGAALLAVGVFYPFLRDTPAGPKNPKNLKGSKDPNLEYVAQNPAECPSPPDLPIAFVKVSPGSFLSSSKPHREVTISKPFCIGRFEVTQTQWKKIMGDNPSGNKGDSLPVEAVKWEEIEDFLKKLNARSPGANYRLPKNDQWEYAARAGPAGAVSYDGNLEDLSRYANCQGRGSENSTIPVGSLAANPWGIFDMYGNVAELVQDDPLPATTPGMSALASILPEKHVRRGGSFRNSPQKCDSVDRSAVQSRRNSDTGFRIIRDLQR